MTTSYDRFQSLESFDWVLIVQQPVGRLLQPIGIEQLKRELAGDDVPTEGNSK